MIKRDMTVVQLIAALRKKARAYNERADALEIDLDSVDLDDEPIKARPLPVNGGERKVTPEELKGAMREKKGRIFHFAERLGTSEGEILAIVKNPANGITNRNKGWLELVEPTGNTASGAPEGGE